MSGPTIYQYVKLGMNLEYLRGICSTSIALSDSLAAFPELEGNWPPRRFEAAKVMTVVRSLLIQLEDMRLAQTLDAAAEFRPMAAQIEAYISQSAASAPIVLQDGFAEKLVSVAKQVSLVLKRELGSADTKSPD